MRNSIKDKILDAVDIVDVIGEVVSLSRKGREFIGLCPFHNDHKPSMSVSPAKQIFKCWSCLAGGNVIKFVQLYHRVEYREALEMLAKRAGLDFERHTPDKRSVELRDRLRKTLDWANAFFRRNLTQTAAGKRALEYARSRGLTEQTIERFEVGLATDDWEALVQRARAAGVGLDLLLQLGLAVQRESGGAYDRFRNRLIFPIRDAGGRLAGFGGRTLGDDPAKYLNSPESALFSKSRILYGLHLARGAITRRREAIVVEGYLDAVLLHQAGIENVVATLGTALTDAHMRLLRQQADRVVMCFDNDEAGLRAADRAVEAALRYRTDVAVLIIPEGKDPADYITGHGREAFERLLQSATPALEFKWLRTRAAFEQAGPQGRRQAVETYLQFVARVAAAGGIDPLEQGLLVGRLAELLSIPGDSVYELLKRARTGALRNARPGTVQAQEKDEYAAATGHLPRGLVVAVEELFGLALTSPDSFAEIAGGLAAGAVHALPWQRLYDILDHLAQERGAYTRAEVAERCEEPVLWELIDRARRRFADREPTGEERTALLRRVSEELDLMRMAALSENLTAGAQDHQQRARAFESLLQTARRRHGPLGAAQQWAAGSAQGE